MALSRTQLEAPGVPPTFYPQGLSLRGVEQLVFISGQVGSDAQGNWLDGVGAQAREVLSRVDALLTAGLTSADIVKMTIYLTDSTDYPAFMAVAAEVMPQPAGTVTALVVPFLSAPEQKVEIEVIAAG